MQDGELQSVEQPLFSILLPVFRTPIALFETCLKSVRAQSFANWELIVIDDASDSPDLKKVIEGAAKQDDRIKPIFRRENGNISMATNDALRAASGVFLLFLDHDDELDVQALARFADAVGVAPDIDAWYSDQVTVDDAGRMIGHFYKPDWSPTYFLGAMYVGHLLAVRRETALALGGFDPTYDGVQDFEFMLRVSEKTQRIGHIRDSLYKWRAIAGSLAYASDAKPDIGRKQVAAVAAHLSRTGRTWQARAHGSLPHRVVLAPGEETMLPPVSIIIPSRDLGTVVERCLTSIYEQTHYPEFEVIIVDNGTVDPIALAAFKRFPVKVVPFNEPFNYSRANNVGATQANHPYLLFLNNDTEIVEREWLKNLAMYLEDQQIGAVGPVLLYPNGQVQHAGVVLGARGTADHVMRYFPAGVDGYGGSLACSREVSAVTGAALLMRRALFNEIGGFSEDFGTHYQDVDLCLKLRELGFRIICAGTRLIHHESLTRRTEGYDFVDRAILIDRWREILRSPDPFYNVNLNLERLDYAHVSFEVTEVA